MSRRSLFVLLVATIGVATSCLPVPPPPVAPPPGPLPTVAVYGDSVALTLGWDAAEGLENRARYVGGVQQLGCGAGRFGLRWHVGTAGNLAMCDDQYAKWAADAAAKRPDVAVIVEGPWDHLLRLTPGDSQWRNLGDPVYDHYLLGEMLVATDSLLDNGVGEVVWMVLPPQELDDLTPTEQVNRATAWRDLVAWVEMLRPGRVTVADMWARTDPLTDDLVRPDGKHFSPDGAVYTWRTWLGDLTIAAA